LRGVGRFLLCPVIRSSTVKEGGGRLAWDADGMQRDEKREGHRSCSLAQKGSGVRAVLRSRPGLRVRRASERGAAWVLDRRGAAAGAGIGGSALLTGVHCWPATARCLPTRTVDPRFRSTIQDPTVCSVPVVPSAATGFESGRFGDPYGARRGKSGAGAMRLLGTRVRRPTPSSSRFCRFVVLTIWETEASL